MNIVLDSNAQRQLKRTPKNIIKKLRDWVVNVMQLGLREVARRPGYHDEPLSGKRSGQRSIRLSKQWRAIYQPFPARIAIETVTPHDYRVKGAAEVDALPFLNELLGEPAMAAEVESMNKTQKREVVATLLKAGRRDLAEQFVGAAPFGALGEPPQSWLKFNSHLRAAFSELSKAHESVHREKDAEVKRFAKSTMDLIVKMQKLQSQVDQYSFVKSWG